MIADRGGVKWRSNKDLRRRFNQYGYLASYLQDKYEIEIVESTPFSGPRTDYRAGTRSQTVWLRTKTDHQKVALVHRFVRPDGTLAASGKPDPKVVFHNGVTYCWKSWRGHPTKTMRFLKGRIWPIMPRTVLAFSC